MFKRLLNRIRYNRRYGNHPGVLRLTNDGLSVEQFCLDNATVALRPICRFSWREVSRILGFKRDLYSVDMICIAFVLRDTTVEINEEMEGFESIVRGFEAHFPGLKTEWWNTVAFPPFATNWTTIWEGSRVNPECWQ